MAVNLKMYTIQRYPMEIFQDPSDKTKLKGKYCGDDGMSVIKFNTTNSDNNNNCSAVDCWNTLGK